MHFIRIIQAATKSNTRTKKLIKPSNTKRMLKNKPSDNLTKKPNKSIEKTVKVTQKGIYPLQDISTQAFKDLQDQGYNMATFVAWPGACNFCKGINGKTWTLDNFIRSTQYDAPVFSHSHVNAQSEIKVWDKTGELPDVFVNYEGDIHQ